MFYYTTPVRHIHFVKNSEKFNCTARVVMLMKRKKFTKVKFKMTWKKKKSGKARVPTASQSVYNTQEHWKHHGEYWKLPF